MGYERETLERLLNMIKQQFQTISGLRMLEFGNQEVYSNFDKVCNLYAEYKYSLRPRVVKTFFEYLQMIYTSIDYNGKDGSLAYDVRQDITSKFQQKFNIITNVGFTEHVGENESDANMLASQYAVFKNIHNLGEINALYYHVVPLTHNWYKHGVCDYSLDFFKSLCDANGYIILDGPFIETYHPEKQASIFYKKVSDTSFMSFDEFKSLPGLRSTAND